MSSFLLRRCARDACRRCVPPRLHATRQREQTSGTDRLLRCPGYDRHSLGVPAAHHLDLLELGGDTLLQARIRRAGGGETAVDDPTERLDLSTPKIGL